MKFLTVVGARPQFIKAAALSPVLRRAHREVLLHTGQHYDHGMSDVFFRELDIPQPDYNLGVGSGPQAWQTAHMMLGIEAVALDVRPDWIIAFGDTNSTLAASIVASKLHVPLAHVEAGLRCYDKSMAEEVNRVITDHVSDLRFCPTQRAVENLARESVVTGVYQVGDVMCDAYQLVRGRIPSADAIIKSFGVGQDTYVLVTIHRPTNVDRREQLEAILRGLEQSRETCILPAHPRTRKAIEDFGICVPKNVHVAEPLGYLAMLALEQHAVAIVTDSGGVQREAYMAGVPCITVRQTTEWPETVTAGWNILVPARSDAITDAVIGFRPSGSRPSLFGDGRAAERIRAILEHRGIGG